MDHILVMGIAGAGKTTLARALADRLGIDFVDADDFHGDDARTKMAAGIGLADTDRLPWIARIKAHLKASPTRVALACSALKQAHRRTLGATTWVYLEIEGDLAAQRLASRAGHFAGESLLESQLLALETPTPSETGLLINVSAAMTTDDQIATIIGQLRR